MVFAHAAEVAAQEDPLAAAQGDAGAAVLAAHLLAFDRLDFERLKRGDDVLGFGIVAEDAHVGGVRPELFGEDGKVEAVAAGVHDLLVLVFVDDVVAKSKYSHHGISLRK